MQNADEVLTAFDSLKLDDLKSQRKKLDKPRQTDTQTFFAKYLTSKKVYTSVYITGSNLFGIITGNKTKNLFVVVSYGRNI